MDATCTPSRGCLPGKLTIDGSVWSELSFRCFASRIWVLKSLVMCGKWYLCEYRYRYCDGVRGYSPPHTHTHTWTKIHLSWNRTRTDDSIAERPNHQPRGNTTHHTQKLPLQPHSGCYTNVSYIVNIPMLLILSMRVTPRCVYKIPVDICRSPIWTSTPL